LHPEGTLEEGEKSSDYSDMVMTYPLYPIKVDLAAKKYCRALLRARQEILVKKTEGLYISHRPANSNSLVCFILKLLTAQG